MADLEAQLQLANANGARFKLISTDGIFSMDGTIAQLHKICDLAKKHGALVHFDDSHGVGFVGNDGTLVVDREGWEVIPEPKGGNPTLDRVDLIKGDGQGLHNHMVNFVDGIKNGIKLNCPIEIAAGVARTCHLGNVAYKTGRRLYWDADNSKFINDAEADSYLAPTYREPWILPKI